MANVTEIMQMCRLCLVKEEVNIPIFSEPEDVHEVLMKITACLPVKISREDNLPKKVCDGCGYKLDLLYQFWNTATSAEKQLIDWLESAGVDPKHNGTTESEVYKTVQPLVLKQEPNADESLSADTQSYILQQQQLPVYQQKEEYVPKKTAQATRSKSASTTQVSEPPAKRPRRATRSKPALKDSSDEDDLPLKPGNPKTEDESDDGDMPDADVDADADFGTGDDEENDTDQPGPSGVGKTDAPYDVKAEDDLCEIEEEIFVETESDDYQCEICYRLFPDRKGYLQHHVSRFGSTFNCCRCRQAFKNTTDLYNHYHTHRDDGSQMFVEEEESLEEEQEIVLDKEEVVEESEQYELIEAGEDDEGTTTLVYADDEDQSQEHVINISQNEEAIASASELLYILDDGNQCVNEIIIEAGEQSSGVRKTSNKADFSVIQVDHGYIMPACFKGKTQGKSRVKKVMPTSSQTVASTSKTSHVVAMDNDEDAKATSVLVSTMQASGSKGGAATSVVTSATKVMVPRVSLSATSKKRQVHAPDFSAANYEVVDPNNDIGMIHYKCLRCEQLFINKFVFFRHIEKGKCYINSCDMCDASFSKNSHFYDHYVNEHTERAICHFCFRTFLYEKNVKEHMLRHLDQFRHRCDECNKGFYTVREYRNHYKNRHMGIRHKCTECGRSFADEYYFKRHLATHGLALYTAEEIEEVVD